MSAAKPAAVSRASRGAGDRLRVDVCRKAALEAVRGGAVRAACETVGFFRDDDDRRLAGRRACEPVGGDDGELAAALALAAAVTGVSVPSCGGADTRRRAGWRAPMPRFPEQLIGRRFAVRGTHLHGRAGAGPDHADAGCRPGLRVGRARLDPRLPARAGARGAAPAAAHPGSGHRLGHPGDGGGAAAASAGAGDRHRAVVGAGGAARTPRLNGAGRLGAASAGRWLARSGGARGGAVRPGVRQYPGAAACADGAAPGGTSGAGRHGDPVGSAGRPRRVSVIAAHRRCGLHLEASIQEGPWTTLMLRPKSRCGPQRPRRHGSVGDVVASASMIRGKGRIEHARQVGPRQADIGQFAVGQHLHFLQHGLPAPPLGDCRHSHG